MKPGPQPSPRRLPLPGFPSELIASPSPPPPPPAPRQPLPTSQYLELDFHLSFFLQRTFAFYVHDGSSPVRWAGKHFSNPHFTGGASEAQKVKQIASGHIACQWFLAPRAREPALPEDLSAGRGPAAAEGLGRAGACWGKVAARSPTGGVEVLGPEPQSRGCQPGSGSVPRARWFPLTDVPTAPAGGREGRSRRKMSCSPRPQTALACAP